MITFLCVLVALAGVATLVFMPLPKDYWQRIIQQATGAALFTLGTAGVIAVVFLKGQLIG
jgi:hypothetical protein